MKRSTVSDALRVLELDAARWQAVLETARDGVISVDTRGRITLFNRAAEAIFGYAAEEVLGANVKMLMPAPYHGEHDDYLRRYRESGVAKAIGRVRDVHGRRKSGEIFPLELSVSEAHIGDDVLYSAIVRDVSERTHMLAELNEAQETARQNARLIDVGMITLKIAHDLGNPVAGLTMLVQRLLRRVERDPTQPAHAMIEPLQQMASTVARLEGLVSEFKSFAREQRLDLDRVDVPGFLEELASAWRIEALARGIALVVETSSGAAIQADETKLRRVFDNLLKNALEAIDRGPGTVRVLAVDLPLQRIRISVDDDGPGVPAGMDVFRLFETTKANGTGLGLAIAKQIVLAHGGLIDCRPRDGRGASFQVELPTNELPAH